MPPTCFVIQPFDNGGEFDKRFDEVIAPAIESAGFEPYRVDRDPNVVIPIDDIVAGIKRSAACVADITLDNPNVWFELGLAIAADKDVALISQERSKFPFDVQHRKVIRYKTSSPGDFATLSAALTSRLRAIREAFQARQTIDDLPNDLARHAGFTQHEMAALALIGTQSLVYKTGPSPSNFVSAMEMAGYTQLAAGLSVRGLAAKGLVEEDGWRDDYDNWNPYYKTTEAGDAWLMSHQDELTLKHPTYNPRLVEPGPA